MSMRADRINQRAVAELARASEVDHQEDRVASQVLTEARRLAPFLTGTLRRSLTVVKVGNAGQTEYRIGWDTTVADYGPAVEFGTEDTPAQPHLRPAAIKVKGR